MPLIIDGKIQDSTLKEIKKSKTWLLNELERKSLNKEQVFYAFLKNSRLYIIKKIDTI